MFTSMFLHAGWLHLLGNLLFLWIFGNNVEDRLGRAGFMLVSTWRVASRPISARSWWIRPPTVPMIGASGAISAMLGAYLVLFPRARIQSLVFLGFFYQLIAVPAVIVLGFWFLLQVVDGVGALGTAAGPDGGRRLLRPHRRVPRWRDPGPPVPAPRATRGIIRTWPRTP